MTPPESTVVAVELAELRGEIRTGMESIKGSLAVLVERTTRTDADVRQLRADTATDIRELRDATDADVRELRAEIEALKRGRWPLPTLGVLAGVGGAVTGLIALFRH